MCGYHNSRSQKIENKKVNKIGLATWLERVNIKNFIVNLKKNYFIFTGLNC